MLTPNGRFELNTKICISFTNYHEELWQPAWGVRTAILGLQGFFPLKGKAAVGVGSVECPTSERRRLAVVSRDWVCPQCQQPNVALLPDPPQVTDSTLQASPEATTVSPSESPAVMIPSEAPDESVSSTNTPSRNAEQPGATGVRMLLKRTKEEFSAESSGHDVDIREAQRPSLKRRDYKPPVLLDAAICVLLVLLFVIICRRMV
ncbi:hypothetical protein AX15_003130 [Amanita polypyramis BW_CC]|nr:hypothetical protein AX15_003130 [Amanita polypyramis BW_CC]